MSMAINDKSLNQVLGLTDSSEAGCVVTTAGRNCGYILLGAPPLSDPWLQDSIGCHSGLDMETVPQFTLTVSR